MPTRDEMMALADRCEKASGPDSELFLSAFAAIFGPAPDPDYQPRREPNFSPVWSEWVRHQTRFYGLVQREAWLDAAMGLVPESCVWNLQINGDGTAGADCDEFIQTADYPETRAATPALALTAACLRALATEAATNPKDRP